VVAAKEIKELNSSRKTKKGFENVEDEGGRYILNTDILERGSLRVTADDSKEEYSVREVGNCVKGSWIRNPVPPHSLLSLSLCCMLSIGWTSPF